MIFSVIFFLPFCTQSIIFISEMLTDVLPVCTWSPFCNSAIVTDFPLRNLTVAAAGKQPHGLQ